MVFFEDLLMSKGLISQISTWEVIDDKSLVVALDDPPAATPVDANGKPLKQRHPLHMPVAHLGYFGIMKSWRERENAWFFQAVLAASCYRPCHCQILPDADEPGIGTAQTARSGDMARGQASFFRRFFCG